MNKRFSVQFQTKAGITSRMQFELYIYLNTKVKRTLTAGDNLPQTHPPTAHTHMQLFQARNHPRTDFVRIYVKMC